MQVDHKPESADQASIVVMDESIPTPPSPEELEKLIQAVMHCRCCGEPMVLVPRIVCAECNQELPIKCQLYKSNDIFYGECLTLNLLSHGATMDEAARRLQVAMFSYVATVLREGASAEGLIPRYAPLPSWIRYYSSKLANRLKYLFSGKPPISGPTLIQPTGEALKVAHCL